MRHRAPCRPGASPARCTARRTAPIASWRCSPVPARRRTTWKRRKRRACRRETDQVTKDEGRRTLIPPPSIRRSSFVIRPSSPPNKIQREKVRPVPTEHKRRQQQQVVRRNHAERGDERDAEHPVEHRQRVESQVDADRPELPGGDERILRQIHQRVLGPPQVPGEGGIVNAIAGHVRGEMRDQRPSEDETEQEITRQHRERAPYSRIARFHVCTLHVTRVPFMIALDVRFSARQVQRSVIGSHYAIGPMNRQAKPQTPVAQRAPLCFDRPCARIAVSEKKSLRVCATERYMGLYQDTLDYIFGYVNYEKQVRYPYDAVTFNLSRMEEVLERLGRPQDRFQCVHIAGTKGKGSTSVMVESVLRTAGYRTGIYTSPHLHTFRERIRLGSGSDDQGRPGGAARSLQAGHRSRPGDHSLRGNDRPRVPVLRRKRRRVGRAGGGPGRPAGRHQRGASRRSVRSHR